MANQNVTQLTQQTGSAAPTSLFYAVTGGSTDTGLPLSVLVNSLGLTGVPTTPTAALSTNTTQIASTAFVQTQLASSLAPYAPLASPTFTGTVTMATATVSGVLSGTNTTQSTTSTTGAIVTAGGLGVALDIFCGGTYHGSIITAAGTINNIPIGASTPNTGAFTTLSASSTVSGTGFSTYLASPPSIGSTVASSGAFTTLRASGLITPTSNIGIQGTTAADSAQAGSIGEYATNTTSGTSLSSGTVVNATSVSLTAGDWDVQGTVQFVGSASNVTSYQLSVSTTSATLGVLGTLRQQQSAQSSGSNTHDSTPMVRINVSATTTVYVTAVASFSTGTATCNGFIRARRVR